MLIRIFVSVVVWVFMGYVLVSGRIPLGYGRATVRSEEPFRYWLVLSLIVFFILMGRVWRKRWARDLE